MKQVTISPITRLEGHGKIEIFLDSEGNVANAYLQVPELRGFEQFCLGRKAEDMPVIMSRRGYAGDHEPDLRCVPRGASPGLHQGA